MTSRVALATLLVAGGGVFAVTAGAPAAQAADGGGGGCTSATSGGTSGGGGSASGSTITMWAQLTVHSQAALCPSGSTSNAGGTDWKPPQCWWAPEYSPEGLAADIAQLDTNGGSADETYTALNAEYASQGPEGAFDPPNYQSTDGPPWQKYNVGASPSGEWWGLIWNEDITEQGIEDCTAIDVSHFPKDWYWVTPTTGTPDPGDAPVLDEHELAEYVAGKVKLNPVTVQTNPDLNGTKATVDLPTWVWAQGAGNTTITDQICTQQQYGGICVNLNAQAASFDVSTNDPAATVYDNCKADAAGVVGTPYTAGAGNPPCGVTFGSPGAWNLVIDTTWSVQITYDGGAITLDPAPVTETDVAANVQEVQAVNN